MIQYSKAEHSAVSLEPQLVRRSIVAETMLDREAILEVVRTWPADQQVLLAHEILRRVRGQSALVKEPPVAPPNSKGLAGLLTTDQPPPTDEEVERWLDEHRMEKYGR